LFKFFYEIFFLANTFILFNGKERGGINRGES